jgi:uncharacterized protein involved in exopolysaccharide biosynthesis
MATHTKSLDSLNTKPQNEEWTDTDEIDVRRYIGIIARRWPEILLTTVIVTVLGIAGVTAFKRLLTKPMYEAVASAAIVRTLTDVNLDQRFTTTSDQPNTMDATSRRAALVALVNSGAIAQEVATKLSDQLNLLEQNPSTLLGMVEGEMGTVNGRPGQSDLILMRAVADSPEKAALIANAWAEAYVNQVNRVYGQVPDELFKTVQAQLGNAQDSYKKAQTDLEQFISESTVDSLTRHKRDRAQDIPE